MNFPWNKKSKETPSSISPFTIIPEQISFLQDKDTVISLQYRVWDAVRKQHPTAPILYVECFPVVHAVIAPAGVSGLFPTHVRKGNEAIQLEYSLRCQVHDRAYSLRVRREDLLRALVLHSLWADKLTKPIPHKCCNCHALRSPKSYALPIIPLAPHCDALGFDVDWNACCKYFCPSLASIIAAYTEVQQLEALKPVQELKTKVRYVEPEGKADHT